MPTLAAVLAERGLDKRNVRALCAEGRVWLDSTPVADLGRVVDGVHLRVERERPRHSPGRDAAIVSRDEHLAVVYKPSGMLSVPAPGRREPSVVKQVERWLGRAFTVHRIDEGTSGLMLVALDEPTQLAVKSLLEVHDVERRYLALVRGRVPWSERRVDNLLVENRGDGRRGSGPGGKPARTTFRRVDTTRDVSVVEARLETGRTHQVRIHLAELGFPILGDAVYDGASFSRLALHAHVLGFKLPGGDTYHHVSPLPDELWRRAFSI